MEIIKWIDARGVSSEWECLKDIKNMELCNITSAGIVIKEDDTKVIIVSHIEGDETACGAMCIPKACIIERKKI